MARQIQKKHINQAWEFPWSEMEVLIGGKSSIDLPELHVEDWDEATRFIHNYGYDLSEDGDKRLIHEVFIEALNFVEKHLQEFSGRYVPPEEIFDYTDIRHLLLWASDKSAEKKKLKAWSCSLLRVMHTIAHIEGVHNRLDYGLAREQIARRFRRHLHREKDGSLWLGEENDRVEIDKIEWKDRKSRESIILKLLHKKANVAETIYDLLGARIVTKRLSDTMMVVKYLRQYYMITFANCNPGRSRNNLIDTDIFKANVNVVRGMLDHDRIKVTEFSDIIESMTQSVEQTNLHSANPHSSNSYRAIQLTCRQLVRFENPNLKWVEKFREHVNSPKPVSNYSECQMQFLKFIDSWPGLRENQKVSFFFPFEVQVMDLVSYTRNQSGDASHGRYKSSQAKAARRRVLGDVIRLKKL